MDYFWQHIIQKKATNSGEVPSQERIFPMKPANLLLRMTYDEFEDSIYCKVEFPASMSFYCKVESLNTF